MTGVTLDAYLRGRAPRPNPSAPWRVEYRHAEGGQWTLLANSAREAGARAEVLAVGGALGHGDMVRMRASKGDVRGFWVVTVHGLVDAGKAPSELGRHGWDWETAWEGRQAEADALLRRASAVHDKRRVLAACDCAETALAQVPAGEYRPRQAIDAARRWAHGEARASDVSVARDAVYAYANALRDNGNLNAISNAAYAASNAAAAALTRSAPSAAAAARAAAGSNAAAAARARDAAFYTKDDVAVAVRALSPLVRRWIPLPIVLLARAGEPTPPSLLL